MVFEFAITLANPYDQPNQKQSFTKFPFGELCIPNTCLQVHTSFHIFVKALFFFIQNSVLHFISNRCSFLFSRFFAFQFCDVAEVATIHKKIQPNLAIKNEGKKIYTSFNVFG
jgi:hypothetical protein